MVTLEFGYQPNKVITQLGEREKSSHLKLDGTARALIEIGGFYIMNSQNQKNIYQASVGEIFIKNFLAGMARGLGSLFVWFLIMFIGYKILWPQLANQMNRLTNLVENLQSNPVVKMNQQIPQDLNNLFKQYVPR